MANPNRDPDQDDASVTSVETETAWTRPGYKHGEESRLHGPSNPEVAPDPNLLDAKHASGTDNGCEGRSEVSVKQPDSATTQAAAEGDAVPSDSGKRQATEPAGSKRSKEKISQYFEPNQQVHDRSALMDQPAKHHELQQPRSAAATKQETFSRTRAPTASGPLHPRNYTPRPSSTGITPIFAFCYQLFTQASLFFGTCVNVKRCFSEQYVAERLLWIQSHWADGGTAPTHLVSRVLAIVVSQAFGDIGEKLRTDCRLYLGSTACKLAVGEGQIDAICQMVVANIGYLQEIISKLHTYQLTCSCQNRTIDCWFFPWRWISDRFDDWNAGRCPVAVNLECSSCGETRILTALTVDQLILLLALLLPSSDMDISCPKQIPSEDEAARSSSPMTAPSH